MDMTEELENATENGGPAGTGRCGWIALGLVIVLIPGIAPVSLFFGSLSIEAVAEVFGRHLGQGIISRLAIMAVVAAAILLSTVVILFLTVTIHRIVRTLVRRTPFTIRKPLV